MKKLHIPIMLMVLVVCISLVAEEAPKAIVDLANSELVKLGTDPVIVEAVNAENAKGKSLEKIKEMDTRWLNTPGVADFMKELMDSKCGKHLTQILDSEPFFAEIFVTDNQGANVAMTSKTSDYWQGDEDKFVKAFNNGAGGVLISDVEFDDSAQAYVVQVSVPVKDGDKVIGTITFGVDVDNVE